MIEDQRQAIRAGGTSTTVHVPMTFQRRGGRKQVVTPDGSPAWAPRPLSVDSTLVKALGRAFRWQRMLDSGTYGSVAELAKAERINASYVCRILRLTLLAPSIVEEAMNGTQSQAMALECLMRPFPTEWREQRRGFASFQDCPPGSPRFGPNVGLQLLRGH
jgi:hypothetical protein